MNTKTFVLTLHKATDADGCGEETAQVCLFGWRMCWGKFKIVAADQLFFQLLQGSQRLFFRRLTTRRRAAL